MKHADFNHIFFGVSAYIAYIDVNTEGEYNEIISWS